MLADLLRASGMRIGLVQLGYWSAIVGKIMNYVEHHVAHYEESEL